MRIALNIFLIIIFAVQCKNVDENIMQQSEWEKTKSSREYLDYAYFIQNNPNSDSISRALNEYFFLRDSVSAFLACARYNAKVNEIDSSKVLFNGYIKDIDSLRFIAFNYLENANGNNRVSSSLKYRVQIPETDFFDSISKGNFEFQFYKKPFATQNLQKILVELSHGIDDYKEFLSNKWFKKSFMELSNEKKDRIDKLIRHRFVFFDFTDINDSGFETMQNKEVKVIDSGSN